MWATMKSPVRNWISSWIHHREKTICFWCIRSLWAVTPASNHLLGAEMKTCLYKPGFIHTHRSPQLQQHEYCNSYQGANSFFHMHIGAPFPWWQETCDQPGTLCLQVSKPAPPEIPLGSVVTELTPGHMWVSVCFLPAHISVKLVLLSGKRDPEDIHTCFLWVPR